MDPPHDLSGADRKDDIARPTNPDGTQSFHPFSDVGLDTITSPKARRPTSAASRRSTLSSPTSNASGWSDRGADYADLNHQANLDALASSVHSVARQAQLGGKTSAESQYTPATTDIENNAVPFDESGLTRYYDLNNKQDREVGHAKDYYEKILLENEKLRINNTALDKGIRALDGLCENQQKEIEFCQEKQVAAERLAECRRHEVVEIGRSKEKVDKELAESQAHIRDLERENSKLRLLEDEKQRRDKAEWQLGDLYGELEQKKAEVSSLLCEAQELRESKQQSEEAQRKSEEERKKLSEQIKRSLVWIQEAHRQQAQRDMEQFRLHDTYLFNPDRRRPSTTSDFGRTSSKQQETLGDFWSSRPQSVTSQSQVSEKAFWRSRTFLNESPSSPVFPRAASGSTTLQSPSMESETVAEKRPPSSKRVSFLENDSLIFRPTPSWSGRHRVGSLLRRQSDPSSRKSRPARPSALRNSLVPDGPHHHEPAQANNGRQVAVPMEDEARAEKALRRRALSMPTTRKEDAEFREALRRTAPMCIRWDASRNRAVFECEPTQTAIGVIQAPEDGPSGAIISSFDAGSGRPLDREMFGWTGGSGFLNSLEFVWSGFSISATLEKYGIMKGTEPGGSRAEPINSSKSPIAQSSFAASISKSSISDGSRCRITPDKVSTVAKAFTITKSIALLALTLLAIYTSISPSTAPSFFRNMTSGIPASPQPLFICQPCPVISEDSAHKAYQPRTEVAANMKTVKMPAWPTEPLILESTETETVTELMPTQIHIHTETETETRIEMKTETVTIFTDSPSPFPPTRSFRRQIRTSNSERSSTILSAAGPTPVPLPFPKPASRELDDDRYWTCSCPDTSSDLCGKPYATSSSSSRLSPLRRSIDATASETGERAKQTRQRNLQLQRLYTGPTYWGLLPEIQQQLDIWQYSVIQLLLGGTRGVGAY
ncbi:uncharacterized protein Z519_06662 [Cladophialophora bantiana CBS 173.52]|uniref:Spindle assembly checkpoint component MAD1 n=1 Tax=Cladophialophora bantiana (strain ATCC 10958 / CBS 173.52 / CDC B-1940 / NIH 8579) TaxID=1442370 RepID=A0A0D2HHR9_CLAB1|nr:uncharacterized protein Z519_06662 [Cladophialophora bantiana CBS 173.52]KIW92813.1 hypothetical protein Z519_06662 [Cladophialophora bantiana CBS 173.52]